VKICDILSKPLMLSALRAESKEGILIEMAQHLGQSFGDASSTAEQIQAALWAREQLGSTGVGEGVAIPHAKIPGLKKLVACFGRSIKGVPFDAIDAKPVHLIFVLLVPENSAGAHLKALARISRLLKSADFRERLLTLRDEDALYEAFLAEDEQP
jgi:PTS system nitrogen regulatory IIA component